MGRMYHRKVSIVLAHTNATSIAADYAGLSYVLSILSWKEKSGKTKNLPSLQTGLPPELAENVIRLYRECLRRAKFIGHRQHNTELVVDMVRQQFKRHKCETDPEKIQELKDDAARGLINHLLYESEKMTGRKFSKGA